ncbi:hypothetical protein ILYODFUR_027565 [Ilyodon furcidens]|uniref:Uncharacterized protein n=1 Tax=Ilyodon furcidens TaxID=33524 RepID=A0ABV0TBT4_9TELE
MYSVVLMAFCRYLAKYRIRYPSLYVCVCVCVCVCGSIAGIKQTDLTITNGVSQYSLVEPVIKLCPADGTFLLKSMMTRYDVALVCQLETAFPPRGPYRITAGANQ